MFLRKYGVLLVTGTTSIRIPIIKRAAVDFAVGADWTPAAGDVKVFVDAAAAANITNLPTAIASGNGAFWEFILTAAELTCQQLLVVVSDAATKAVEDQSFIVETYGNASARYVTDLSAQLATPTNITAGTITTATNVTTVNGLAANVITATSINADAITAAKIADGAIDAATFAAGAINAAAIAADAIGASELAADAVAEIADAIWDEDATAHQTLGTFGQAIGDPVADTNTIFKAVVTDATGATVGVDVVAVKADTAAILIDTAEIGAAGAGLTAIDLPNQTMDIVGNLTGNVSGSVGSVTGAVGSVTAAVAITSNIKQNQALANFEFMMTDSTTHAPVTGKAVTVTRSIDGGAFAAGALSAVTEVSNGIYRVDFAASDLNGKVITLRATAATSDDTFERIVTQV